MAEEFNLEESNAYFASDKLRDFVKKQSSFDKLMMSRSAMPIASFDFILTLAAFLSMQAIINAVSYGSALFFAATFCASGYSLGLFTIRFRFDRWQSLLLSLKSWILAYAFTLGVSPLWLGDRPLFWSITIGSIGAGIIVYIAHWYLARGLRHQAFNFVVMGDPTPTTISLLKEVRRPREVVSYRHIHKLYHLISSQKGHDASQVVHTLAENDISTIVLTTHHNPTPSEELLLIEAQKNDIDCIAEEDLWENITKCTVLTSSKRNDFLKALQVDGHPAQAAFRRVIDTLSATLVLAVLFPLFAILYVIASMRIGTHAIAKHNFMGINRVPFTGRVLIFSSQSAGVHKELKIGQHAQNSFFERWCWKSGIWKYPLLLEVIKGNISLVGSPLKSPRILPVKKDSETSLEMVLDKTMYPGIISHFELVEQEPTYFQSANRQPMHYTLYYRKHRSLLLDGYMIALCLLNKVVGRSPQRAWLEI